MKPRDVEQDERTIAVSNAGYRRSYHVLSFGMLAIAAVVAVAMLLVGGAP